MGWRNIVIQNESKISVQNDFLVVTSDRTVRIHMSEIQSIIIENPSCRITGHVLNRISNYKIMCTLCDETHQPNVHLVPIQGHVRQSKHLKQQAYWSKERCDMLWGRLVVEKIKRQGDVVLHCSRYPEQSAILYEYMREVEPGDTKNREGIAARKYFGLIFESDFIRHAETHENAALNYGYSLLLGVITRIISSKGYSTAFGIHHKSEYNPHNLASDLMEPFRPYIDRIVLECNLLRGFQSNHRKKLHEFFDLVLIMQNKKYKMYQAIEEYCSQVFRYLTDDTLTLNDIHVPEYIFEKKV